MDRTIALEPSAGVKRVGMTAFPQYRGRKYEVIITDSPVSLNSHWDGGSRTQYRLIRADGAIAAMPQSGTVFDGALSTPPQIAPSATLIIVAHTISCGEDMGITFYIAPTCVPAWLPSPSTAELTQAESLVLLAACALKASYNGRPARRDECARKGIAREAYDTALVSLQAKGMLNKAGAVTVLGRNTASTLPNRYCTF